MLDGGFDIEKPGLVNQLLADFLSDRQTPKYLPMGALDQ